MSREISTIVTGMSYLEGPRWHDQRIWFSDFYTNRVYSAAEDGSDLRTEAEVPRAALGARLAPGRPPADRLHARRPPAAPRG